MKKPKAFYKPRKKSYVHLKVRLTGKTIILGVVALGIASGLNEFLKYLIRKYAYKTVYGKLPPEDNCKIPMKKKKPMGFAYKAVKYENSD